MEEKLKAFEAHLFARTKSCKGNLNTAIEQKMWHIATHYESQLTELKTVLTDFQQEFKEELK